MTTDADAILSILNRVQESVRNVDYEAVRDLIPDDGLYFGSVAPAARGFEELCAQQFTKVWPNISESKFIADSIDVKVSGDLACAISLFESDGTDPAGNPIHRKGRLTFLFERRDGSWIMVHSHDSLIPTPPGS